MTARRSERALVALYVAVLLAATLAPLPADAYALSGDLLNDKAVHVLLFGGLAAIVYWTGRATAGAAVRALAATAALAAFVELVQIPLPYRTGDWWDLFWGVAGGAAAVGLLLPVMRWTARKDGDA